MDFSCGFYADLAELQQANANATFGFLKDTRVTSESSAYNFLHGSCADFAAILSDVFGYEIECVRNADHRLIHAYCVSHIGDEKAYIDIRGITTDPERFFSEFENELTYYSPTGEILVEDEDGFELNGELEIWSNKEAGFDGEFEGWDDPEIESFIRSHADYYDSGQYINVFRCKTCGSEFEEIDDEDFAWFEDYGEEALWGHIQLDHPELYQECQTWETPDMLEVYYEHSIEKKVTEMERMNSSFVKAEEQSRTLDAIISDARDVLNSRKGPDDGAPGAPARENELPQKTIDAISRQDPSR